MKRITCRKISVLLIGCLIFSSCNQAPLDATSEISEANKVFMESFNSGDMKAVAQHYTEDAKLFPANSEIVTGKETIEAFWSGAMSMGVKKVLLETTTAESFGNTAIEEGKYTLYTEGEIVLDKGKYIVVWEKVNGQWLLDRDIWNTSNPLPVPDPEPIAE